MNYSNVVLIFPTIALLSENLERVVSDDDYLFFRKSYRIHTLSEVKELGDKNLFIYTPERYLSFIEKSNHAIEFDFAFVDEVYKIDNDYIIDEEVRENERDVAYRLAVFHSLNKILMCYWLDRIWIFQYLTLKIITIHLIIFYERIEFCY